MDQEIDEKRVYADRTGAETVLIAAEQGVVIASLSGDRVGEFGLEHRTAARDVAAAGNRRAIATAEDVLVGDDEPTDFGPAVTVGFDGEALLAAGPDGRVARLDDEWATLGTVTDPRAIDGGMVAADSGVHQVVDDGLRNVGLGDVRDVHGRGMPLAATGNGLYRLGNGWMDDAEGAFDAVSVAADDRAHAAGDDGLFERERVGSWHPVDVPTDARLADVAHTDAATVAVTETGTLLADAGDGWRTQELGVTGVAGVAVQA
ncbi:HVO_0234 family beta-propeller protein [Haloplanus sp. C73]|uniref:HVO_0234 family beta-propeller protein n=1 Tax=Haloplanus sp. C73 TaxID=3421641 RepID=UPI003EC03B2A